MGTQEWISFGKNSLVSIFPTFAIAAETVALPAARARREERGRVATSSAGHCAAGPGRRRRCGGRGDIFSNVLPNSFETDAFAKDVTLFAVLNELCTLVNQLAADLSDTKLAVGSDAINAGTELYGYVKTAAKKVPGIKTVEEKLRPRFAKGPRQKTLPLPKAG